MQSMLVMQNMVLGALMAAGTAAYAAPDQSNGSKVYEEVTWAQGHNRYVTPFSIDQSGLYHAALTDFEFPNPLKEVNMAVIGSPFEQAGKLGELTGPGSFDFQATAGDYFLAVYYDVDGSGSNLAPLGLAPLDLAPLDIESTPVGDLGLFGIEITSQASTVPVPAAMLFLASGLGLVQVFGRRRAKR